MKKETFLFIRTTKLVGAAAQVLSADYNKQGRYACIQNMSVTDETSPTAKIDVGFLRGTDFVPIQSFMAAAAGQTVGRSDEIWTRIDDQPACRVTGGVALDQIQFVIGGYILYEDEG